MPDKSNPLHDPGRHWAEEIRLSPNTYPATNSMARGRGASVERVPGADEALPAPLPPYRVLTGLAGQLRTDALTYHRAAEGNYRECSPG